MKLQEFLKPLRDRYADQSHYLAAVDEVAPDIISYLDSQHADKADYALAQRMLEPERIVQFRVDWQSEAGNTQTNWGYRVQHSSVRGPYKGGLRFDPSVDIDILKFLALEQTFKNALTGMMLGSGKGGSDFNPKNKTDTEIKRFCQAFITALYQSIGPNVDVPAGDIGVGEREIGYMYGQYKKMLNQHGTASFTGKHPGIGGSLGRAEATGYGVVYLARDILTNHSDALENKQVAISGSGNVATFAALKAIELKALVVTLSDRQGYLYKSAGLSTEDITIIQQAKREGKRLADIAISGAEYHAESILWQKVDADIYIPCATQNELDESDALSIIEKNAVMIIEGANMPSTAQAVAQFRSSSVLFVPAKAANAGGVAVSALEMSQNAARLHWKAADIDARLQEIMADICQTITQYGRADDGSVDYLRGANIGGFVPVFLGMKRLGW